ncbi:FecR family protein [Pedobacter frigoris]|uniref:FecR family protein n=1 Tax=Pedobacter frigoris TaxID=2571272 RepID=UPI00292FA88B|nr:FecR domain-containing protein [Pedobacter frigoris]
MQKERKYLEELFQKYQQGLVSEEEKTLIAHWLIHLNISEPLSDEQLQARQQLSQHGLKSHFFPAEIQPAKITRFQFWIPSIAASLLVLSAIACFFYFNDKNRKSVVNPIAMTEIITRTGEKKIISLSDGSRITLNTQSRLKYPPRFAGNVREVSLSGEAFFEVAHNPSRPFKVHTDQFKVQVLGTSFNIKAYGEDEELSVSVASGKVGILPAPTKSKSYLLMPGDQLTWNRSNSKFSQSRTAIADISSWQKGKLIFRNETLENITRELQRYYKVKFQFNNKSLLTKQINLKIKNQSITTVMKALSISGEFQYKIEGNKITLW